MTTINEKHNGYTNYATWRINLELVDGSYISTIGDLQAEPFTSIGELAYSIQAYCEEFINNSGSDTTVASYALAFIAQVNWYEIAQLVADEHPDLINITSENK